MFEEYGDRESDYVFVNLFAEPYGAPLRYQAVHKLVYRLRERSGIDFTLHMLRHSRATSLRGGVDVEVVARLLGHRSSATTSQISAKARELHQPGEVREVCPGSKGLNAAPTAQHRSFVTWDYVRTSP
jgi:integrase